MSRKMSEIACDHNLWTFCRHFAPISSLLLCLATLATRARYSRDSQPRPRPRWNSQPRGATISLRQGPLGKGIAKGGCRSQNKGRGSVCLRLSVFARICLRCQHLLVAFINVCLLLLGLRIGLISAPSLWHASDLLGRR